MQQQHTLNIKETFLSIEHDIEIKSTTSSSFIKRERIAIGWAFLSQTIWASGVILIRSATRCNKFSPNSYSLWRSVFMSIITYITMKLKQSHIISLHEVPNKTWFIIRTFGIYFSFLFYIISLLYLRTSTTSCLGAANPFVVMILSVVVLKETFYMRYLIGMIVCFIGSAMLVLNEKTSSSSNTTTNNDKNIPVGLFFIICHILTCGFAVFSQKIMIIHKIDADNQVLFTGLSNCLVAFVVALVEGNFGLNFGVVFLAFLNAIIFYLGITTTDWAMAMMDASKFAPTAYIQTLFVFILVYYFSEKNFI